MGRESSNLLPECIQSIQTPTEWDSIVSASSGSLPLHKYEVIDLLAQTAGRKFVPISVETNTHVYPFPLIIARQGPMGLVPVVRNTGIYDEAMEVAHADVVPLAEAVRTYARQEGIPLITTRLRTDSVLTKERMLLQQRGYEVQEDPSYVIPLTDGMRRRAGTKGPNRNMRSNVRTAEKNSVRITDISTEEMERDFVRILTSVYTEHHAAMEFPVAAFHVLWEEHRDDPDFAFRVAHVSGTEGTRVVGVSVVVKEADRANLWKVAVAPSEKQTHASSALYADAITWASEQGCTTLDLGGAPGDGIAHYKRQWGAAQEPGYMLRVVTYPSLQLLDNMRRSLRNGEGLLRRGR